MTLRPKLTCPQMWDPNQYWLKAKAYYDRMEAARGGSADAPMYAALSIEYFARSALCSVHPALNADPQDEGAHIMFSLGLASPKPPRTIPIHAVFKRLNRIFPAVFTEDHQKYAEYMTKLRNEEVHSALLPFEGLNEGQWLAEYYDLVLAALKILGRRSTELFPSKNEAKLARAVVKERRDRKTSEVKKRIGERKRAFNALDRDQRTQKRAESEERVRFQDSSAIADCPACGSKILLRGTLLQVSEPEFDGDQLLSQARFATQKVLCTACKLRLRGATEISVAKLPPRFHEEWAYDLHESRDLEREDEYDNM